MACGSTSPHSGGEGGSQAWGHRIEIFDQGKNNFWEKNRLELSGEVTRYSSLQTFVFSVFEQFSLQKTDEIFWSQDFRTDTNHSRDWFCTSWDWMNHITMPACNFPGSWSGCARHDQMLLRFALHESGAGCCFERDAGTSFRGGQYFSRCDSPFLGKLKMLEEESAWL